MLEHPEIKFAVVFCILLYQRNISIFFLLLSHASSHDQSIHMTRSRNMWILECRNAATAARISRPIASISSLSYSLYIRLDPSLSEHKIRNKRKIRQTHPKRIQSYFYVFKPRMWFQFLKQSEREWDYRQSWEQNRIRRRKNGIDNKKIDALTQLLCKSERNQLRLYTENKTKNIPTCSMWNFDSSSFASHFQIFRSSSNNTRKFQFHLHVLNRYTAPSV